MISLRKMVESVKSRLLPSVPALDADVIRAIMDIAPHAGAISKYTMNVLGGNVNSGNMATGEVLVTQGGTQKAAFLSGGTQTSLAQYAPGAVVAGNAVLLQSGAGRLKAIQFLSQASGTNPTFFDAVGVVSGAGPWGSGYPMLTLFGNTLGVSGSAFATLAGPAPVQCDIPFSSGLCVNVISGCPQFSCTWVPEFNVSYPH